MHPHHLPTEAPKSISHCRIRGSGHALRHVIPVICTVDCNQTLVVGTLLRTPSSHARADHRYAASQRSQRAYGHIYDKYVYRYCIPSVVDMGCGRSPAIPPYRRRFRYLHCPLFIKSTDGYSGSPSIITLFTRSHTDPGALSLIFVCLELKIGGSMPGVA